MTGKRKAIALAAVAALVVGGAVTALVVRDKSGPGPLTFRVDPTLRASVEQVEPIEGSTLRRHVGVIAAPGGNLSELVLDEVIVHVRDADDLAAFLGRWNGQVLDSFPADDEGQDHLVRIDTGRVDPDDLAHDLAAVEPRLAGPHRVSDEGVLRLLAVAAAEWKRGTEVVVDWLMESTDIGSGEVYEAADITQNGRPKSVFDWSYMMGGGALNTGVAAAWQLLEAHGKLTPQVRYMVVDGGFNLNPDLPLNSKIRKSEWGKRNPGNCTNGASCPWHGVDVVLAGMAKVDNRYGVAGPAGPVVSQLIAVGNDNGYWKRMRLIEDMAKEEDPDVVNLSFTRDVNIGSGHAKKWTDRRMRHVRDTGALIVAAAGNNGRSVDGDTLWVPCESTYVMCVGGFDKDATVHPGSNYGEGDSTTSVEIYGPYCVRTIINPASPNMNVTLEPDGSAKNACGTSFASPFVGGVAALVMAADPSLEPEEVRKILNDTANVGGLGSKVTGSQRRVNALQAVARALGVNVPPPTVKIDAPANNKEIKIENWVDLRGAATGHLGHKLTISWESDKDGPLVSGNSTSIPRLSEGTHVLSAKATDFTGLVGEAKVTVKVVDHPAQLQIVSPGNGYKVEEGDAIALVATSMDPDSWQPIPDGDAKWEVRRGGTVVHNATGHIASLPGNKAVPGSYTVRFTAGGSTAQASFTVTAVPPGQTKPTAKITKPDKNISLGTSGGPRTIAFAATATDAEDGTVSGMRFRWTARSGTQTKVLCTGSNVPGAAPPGSIVAPKSCASFSGQLGVSGGGAITRWVVELEVFDSTGRRGTDSVVVEITLAVP